MALGRSGNVPGVPATPMNKALMQMEHLNTVVRETLHLFLTVGQIERICKKTMEINGVTVPEDMVVMILAYGMHHGPAYWLQPEEFTPERNGSEGRECMIITFKLGIYHCLTSSPSITMRGIPLLLDTQGFLQSKKPIIPKMVPQRLCWSGEVKVQEQFRDC
uniref:Uncharacterized protein n=1 Tax=Nothoprocta perdicaria TaxID=30464 RepID=A0A8C6YLY7_NOTPE